MINRNGLKICDCECHKKDISVIHCMPCCNYTYEKYLEGDGELDFDEYRKVVIKHLSHGGKK